MSAYARNLNRYSSQAERDEAVTKLKKVNPDISPRSILGQLDLHMNDSLDRRISVEEKKKGNLH